MKQIWRGFKKFKDYKETVCILYKP